MSMLKMGLLETKYWSNEALSGLGQNGRLRDQEGLSTMLMLKLGFKDQISRT